MILLSRGSKIFTTSVIIGYLVWGIFIVPSWYGIIATIMWLFTHLMMLVVYGDYRKSEDAFARLWNKHMQLLTDKTHRVSFNFPLTSASFPAFKPPVSKLDNEKE